MKTGSSCTNSPGEGICKSEKMSKSFKDISKYFSEEEWAKLTKWQKSAYVFMKRNYIRMTGLGVTVNQPVFMRGKDQLKESQVKESGKDHDCQSKDKHSEEPYGVAPTKGLKTQEASWEGNYRKRVRGAHGPEKAQRRLLTHGKANVFQKHSETATGPKRSHESAKKPKVQKRKRILTFDESSDDEGNN